MLSPAPRISLHSASTGAVATLLYLLSRGRQIGHLGRQLDHLRDQLGQLGQQLILGAVWASGAPTSQLN